VILFWELILAYSTVSEPIQGTGCLQYVASTMLTSPNRIAFSWIASLCVYREAVDNSVSHFICVGEIDAV